MCSVVCTSYAPAQNETALPNKAYTNEAFLDINETSNDGENDVKYNANSFEGGKDEDVAGKKSKNVPDTSYRMHYRVGDVPAPHLTFMFGLQVSI